MLMMKRFLNGIFSGIVRRCSPRWQTRLWYLRVHHRWPNVSRPRKYTEKIMGMKLYDNHDGKVALTDKLLVKHHIAKVLGPDFVIPTLWSGTGLPPRNQRAWAIPFVLKANHGSGMNFIVRSKQDLDWDRIECLAESWMKRDWPAYLCEDWYNKIDRRLLVEPLIGRPGTDLQDFKLFVFSGQAKFIQVNSNRLTGLTHAYHDRHWDRAKVHFDAAYPPTLDQQLRPARLKQMIEAAEKLAQPYEFVRIDLYDLPEGLKFGEMTFAPNAGLGLLRPRNQDRIVGQLWDDCATQAKSRRVGR